MPSTIEPRTSVVTIYQGDYLDRIRHIEQRHEAAVESEKKSASLLIADAAEADSTAALSEQHKALTAEAEESALHVTVKALGRRKWRQLVAEHPPRTDHQDDQKVGVNEDTFKDVLVAASIVEPDLTEDDLDALSDVDFDRLYFTAFALNRMPGASPKALASPTSQKNYET